MQEAPVISFDAAGATVGIRRPTCADCDEFIALMQASQEFHHPWADFPKTRERYYGYVRSRQPPADDGFLVCERQSNRIVGVINLNCIVRGLFQSAYLGYGVGAQFARRGHMAEGLNVVTAYAFGEMNLHRLEANIQPGNLASIALVRRCNFRKEGFSPKYLQVWGEWRDHERWALVADERPC
jgi:ribosomal-protein-alanine N-acetyltransferase